VLRRALIAAVALVAVLASPVQASSVDVVRTQVPPPIAAAAWYLVGDDGAVLAAHRQRQRRAIASITKLMTAVVALERASPSDLVTVRDRTPVAGESTVYLRTGERLTVSDLLRATLVPSANDAAHALALHAGEGSTARFVELMNAKARALGMTDTRFRNPHGLDEAGHVSSARDATLLLRYALGIPFLRDALARTSVTLPSGRGFPTTDDLLETWPRLVGGKTGHTRDAGWSQAAAASAKGITVYGTVLGSETREDRNDALRALLQHGLDRYRRVTAVDASRVYARVETGYGRPDAELVVRRSLLRTVRDDLPLVEHVVAPTSVELPVRAGQALGRVEIWYRSRLVASSTLVAATSISEPSVLGKGWWYAESTASNFWELVT
jgi:serine-type D-Ala-D-Ala carboxypeptidase (penicillin-binding protein 5/6)